MTVSDDARAALEALIVDRNAEAAAANQAESALADAQAAYQVLSSEYEAYRASHPDEEPPPPPPPPPPPTSTLQVGWSMSPNPHPGSCGVARVYDPGSSDVDTAVNAHHVKRIALTSQDDATSGATVVSRIRNVLLRHPGVEVDYAHENEVDRHRVGDIPRWAQEHKGIQDAIRGSGLAGVKTAIDLTAFNTRSGVGEQFLLELKRIGALPDVLAASMYPAGRKQSPPVESPMADHIDLFVDLAVKYGIRYVSCWEIGTPISSRYDRPTLAAKWVKRLRDYSASRGVVARDMVWWDQDIGIDNRFAADGSTATVQGKTQKAWLAA